MAHGYKQFAGDSSAGDPRAATAVSTKPQSSRETTSASHKVALITGAAQRIGAAIATELHRRGYRVIIHYHHSAAAAQQLAADLNAVRADSARCINGNLQHQLEAEVLATAALSQWGRLDALINNASSFYPTPLGSATEADWDALIGSNMKGPFFLAQALAPMLDKHSGCIVNIVDIFAVQPLADHPLYCMAKAGLAMMTKSLAGDLAPRVRVNGVAPGAILWPEPAPSASQKQTMLDDIPLQTLGSAADIANTVAFLVADAPYISGQILAVDGGRSLQS